MNSWVKKFACAFRGVGWSLRSQNSFWVHGFFTIAAITVGSWLRIDRWAWTAIVVAVVFVVVAELFNTVIEQLVQVLHPSRDERIGRALDISAGAVLVAASGAVVIGLITLGPPLIVELKRWL